MVHKEHEMTPNDDGSLFLSQIDKSLSWSWVELHVHVLANSVLLKTEKNCEDCLEADVQHSCTLHKKRHRNHFI